MLFGCPVIASDVSDNSVILGENNERGILCDPHSPESICDAIEILENMSNANRLKMVKSARVFAEENFDIESKTSKYLSKIDFLKKA